MKKFQQCLLCVLYAAGVMFLTGCDSKQDQNIAGQESLMLVFWAHSPSALAGWKATLKDFEVENPDIKLYYTPIEAATWGGYLDKISVMIAGGKEPDIVYLASEGVPLFVNRGLIRSIDDLFERDNIQLQSYIDDVDPALIESFRINGKLYNLPYTFNSMVMYFNTKLLKKAGLAMPGSDWTKEDFLEYARKLTVDKDGDGLADQYGFAFSLHLFESVIPWLYANETSYLKDNDTASNLEDPKVIEVVQFMRDLIHKHKVSPQPGGAGFNIFNSFMAENVAMFGAGRWPILAFQQDEFADFDIQYWPKWNTQVTEFGVDGLAILKSSKNIGNAWELIKFLGTCKVQNNLVGTKDSPLGNIPVRRSVAQGEEMAKMPPANFKIYYESLENSKQVPMPIISNEIESIWSRNFGQILSNQVSVDQGIRIIHKEINDAFKRNKLKQ